MRCDASLHASFALIATSVPHSSTGFYLCAGKTATITVPESVVAAGGWSVLVGAATSDMSKKPTYKRLDRVSVVYPIDRSVHVTIISPLGGGIYLQIPIGSDLGMVEVLISGGVIAAPFFRADAVQTTSTSEWDTPASSAHSREAKAPWADFETSHFLMQARWFLCLFYLFVSWA